MAKYSDEGKKRRSQLVPLTNECILKNKEENIEETKLYEIIHSIIFKSLHEQM